MKYAIGIKFEDGSETVVFNNYKDVSISLAKRLMKPAKDGITGNGLIVGVAVVNEAEGKDVYSSGQALNW